ncbi:MAG: phosphoribosylformylglycinamidine synthase subunit PurS [Candidatus Nitrosocaldaceae archaeon]
MEYEVEIIIETKPYLSDPEGDTILKDLVLKGGYDSVKRVKSAKLLRMTVDAKDAKEAEDIVRKICDELRIYNPVVSDCKVISKSINK